MYKAIIGIISILSVAVVSYFAYFTWSTAKSKALVSEKHGEAGLIWLKSEFNLSEAEFGAVKVAHDAYAPHCEQMCMDLASARNALFRLTDSDQTDMAMIESALTRVHDSEGHCLRMTLKHVQEVSQLMDAEKGKRYRKEMTVRLLENGGGYRQIYNEPQ